MGKQLLCTILSLFLAVFVYGQDVGSVSQISLEHGLSDRTVKDIVRDKYGYLWISTRNGLNRYDGLHIETYDNYPERQTRISAKDIHNVLPRPDGSLVIQYEANRRFVDLLTSESTVAQKLFLNRENGVVGIVERIYLNERTGDVYLLVEQDSSLVVQRLGDDNRFDSLYQVQNFHSRPSSIYELLPLADGTVWINDNNQGLIYVDTLGMVQNHIIHDSIGLPPEYGEISILHQDRQGRIWLAFEHASGLWEYNEAAADFTRVSHAHGALTFNEIWEDKLGSVLLGHKVGKHVLRLFLVKSDDVLRPADHFLSVDTEIFEVYSEDFEGLVFLGTASGVKRINQNKKKVRNYLDSDVMPDLETSIRGITSTQSGHVILAGAHNSWYIFDPVIDSVRPLPIDRTHPREVTYCNCARELLYDSTGCIWGVRYSDAYKAELLCLRWRDTTLTSYPFPYKIQSLTMGWDGRIWLVSGEEGQVGRLTAFNTSTKTFHHYFGADDLNPLRDYVPTFVFEDSRRLKWVGTTDGLLKIDVEKGTTEVFQFSENDYYGLSSNYVYTIAEDIHGDIWIGTDAGANVYTFSSGEFRFYDTRDGLADNNVCGILEDEKENLWFSTYSGLSYFDRELNSFRNFGVSDGFSQDQFNRYAFHADANGNFYFGGVNGLNVFNPNELLERDLNAPILLSSISYYDQEEGAITEHLHNLNQIKQVRLPASNRYFECSFALADYSNPQLNQYQYKLEGLDIDWNYLGTQNEIRFNNLPSGSYKLRIRGADRNLNVSQQEFVLPLVVEQYFYKKVWFLLVCMMLLSLAVYLIHRIKLQQAINMERLRTKISSDLHDDVGGLLSGLAMQTELLQYSAKESDIPKLQRISEMSRNAMAQMRDVIWATDARKDKFEDLLIRMKEYAAEMLFAKGISCSFDIRNINKDKKIPVQVRQNLYLIFKEAITNVAKHSDARQVEVRFEKEGSRIKLMIRDDGKGHLNGHEATTSLNGSGLKNMQMRAESINAQLNIDKEHGYCVALEMKAFL